MESKLKYERLVEVSDHNGNGTVLYLQSLRQPCPTNDDLLRKLGSGHYIKTLKETTEPLRNCLIVTCGFMGDIAFSTAIARTMKERNLYDEVDYLIGFPQMERLLSNDPHINNVFVGEPAGHPHPKPTEELKSQYDKVFQLKPLSFLVPPPVEFQQQCGL